MTHGHVHEEAEHASHHAADPFDKNVALTMVVIAALLAGVKVVAHRTHNATLSYQIQAGDEQGKASKATNDATTRWNLYQAKKARDLAAIQDGKMALRTAPQPLKPRSGSASWWNPNPLIKGPTKLAERQARIDGFVKEVKKEGVEEADAKKAAEKAVELAELGLTKLLNQGYPRERADDWVKGELTAARYRTEGQAIMKKARAAEKASDEHEKKADKYRDKSEALHHQADWFDMAELAVELGIVVCSVAILSKDQRFWIGGIVLAAIGAVIALLGFFPGLFGGGHGAGH